MQVLRRTDLLIAGASRRIAPGLRRSVAALALAWGAAACASSDSSNASSAGDEDASSTTGHDTNNGPSTNVAPPVKQTGTPANEADEGAPPLPPDAAPPPVLDAGKG
jgi:hypothetical protein